MINVPSLFFFSFIHQPLKFRNLARILKELEKLFGVTLKFAEFMELLSVKEMLV